MDGFLANPLSLLREHFRVDRSRLLVSNALLLGGLLCACSASTAQVFTVEREHVGGNIGNLTTLQPTSVHLTATPITVRTREELIRLFQSEQAFAVRPLPLGRQGLVLHANGPLSPSGSGYVDELEKNGISSKPGDRIVISKFDVQKDRIVFEFNGGPEKHHSILQHVYVGGGVAEAPLARDDGHVPVGSRLSLVFDKFVPELNAAELRELIAPMLDFSLKTPVQAYADTLPPKLKAAVLDHEVLVGMNRDMVTNAMGAPDQKVREKDGDVPFEEWIYGTPPHEVQFVRFNGDRVVRLEIADVGQKLVIRDKDETNGYSAGVFVHEVRVGDAPAPNSAKSANADPPPPTAPPTLRRPGEKLPDAVDQSDQNSPGQMKPVQLPPKEPPPNTSPAPSDKSPSPAASPSPGAPGSQSPGDSSGTNPIATSSGPDGPP
jgi:hypothetical protein